jgi:hypothetical protein
MFSAYQLDITVLNEVMGDAPRTNFFVSIVYKGFAAVIGEAITAGQTLGLEEVHAQPV